MAERVSAELVKLIISVLFKEDKYLKELEDILTEHYGKIDLISEKYQFEQCNYYKKEMGSPLFRIFYSFENLIDPADIVGIRCFTETVENIFMENNRRNLNIDPGYIDYGKFILASAKYGTQKVYLGKGVYADIILYFYNKKFMPLIWTFPDFKEDRYYKFFYKVREIYKRQLKRFK